MYIYWVVGVGKSSSKPYYSLHPSLNPNAFGTGEKMCFGKMAVNWESHI